MQYYVCSCGGGQYNVISNVVITADSKTRKPVGAFTCKCGYCYSRTGPDQSDKDRYRKGRVKTFGHVWENKLQDLFTEKNLSYRKLALSMGCDVKTIQKFEYMFAEKTVPQQRMEVVRSQVDKDMHETYKNSLLNIITEQPHLSRTEIRQLCQKEYTFLYRNNREWLFRVLPSVKSASGSQGYIDWQERDQQILLKLQKAQAELLHQEKLIRISTSSLGKKIGELSLLEKHLDKLPNCNDFIIKVSEATQQFQLRRCQQIIENMKQEGLPLIEWKIWRKAGLRQEDYKLIKDQLEWILEENSKRI